MSIVPRVLRREKRNDSGCKSPKSVPTANADPDSTESSAHPVSGNETKKMNLTISRKYFLKKLVENTDAYGGKTAMEKTIECEEGKANLISSRLNVDENLHAPAIDIDVPCRLVRSSTEGHFHLYIDVPMTWTKYLKLLEALHDAGVVESGYLQCARRDKQSLLRKPGITKGQALTQIQEDLLELSLDPSST